MAKKKKIINLSAQNITYQEQERYIKIISFNPNTMEVEVSSRYEGESKQCMKIPFAHLPKEIKKIIKPN